MKTDFKKNKILWIVIAGVILVAPVFIVLNINESKYLRSAKAGGDYLVNHMYEDGSFVYEYNPVTRKEPETYNILRHAGTAYALLELYGATGNEKYLNGAERALVYLNNQIIDCPTVAEASCVEEGGDIKLGGNGLAVLAFAEYARVTGSLDYIPQAEKLATYIVSTQDFHGEFVAHKIDSETGAVDEDLTSLYYPGEAIFALTRLYEVDGNKAWLTSAHAGAQWIIGVRDVNVPTEKLEHDHWLLYGLNELYKDTPDPQYLAHAKRIVEAIASIQIHDKTNDQVDWNGGFYNPPRSTPTATRSEGLGAAYNMFVSAGDSAYEAVTKDVMAKAIDFQLRTQFTKRQLSALDADTKAVGGFHESLDLPTIRIDYVQHNISALLAFERIVNQK